MQKAQEIEAQIYELRERYDAVLERRIEHLNVTGYFNTATPDQCDNPDYEMEALEDWLLELRQRLTELRPDENHYGRVLKSSASRYKGKKHSNFGDNGYYICSECKGIFKFGTFSEEAKKHGRDRESFDCCSEHKDRKKEATLTLLTEEMKWL
jgi:hypothetical protein